MIAFPSAADILLLFPAFLIGSAFGSLVRLGLLGENVSADRAWAVVRVSAAGSAAGALIFALTASWWPPVIGPFVACPAASLAAGAISGYRWRRGRGGHFGL